MDQHNKIIKTGSGLTSKNVFNNACIAGQRKSTFVMTESQIVLP